MAIQDENEDIRKLSEVLRPLSKVGDKKISIESGGPHISRKIGPVVIGVAFLGLLALPCVLWALGSISTTLWLSSSGVGVLTIIGSVIWVRWNSGLNSMLRWSRRMEKMKEGSGGEAGPD